MVTRWAQLSRGIEVEVRYRAGFAFPLAVRSAYSTPKKVPCKMFKSNNETNQDVKVDFKTNINNKLKPKVKKNVSAASSTGTKDYRPKRKRLPISPQASRKQILRRRIMGTNVISQANQSQSLLTTTNTSLFVRLRVSMLLLLVIG